MAHITKLLGGMAAMLFLSSHLYAANLLENQEDITKYDWKMCVNQHADFCVSTICITSENRDCSENCHRLAKEECKEKLIE